MCGRHRYAGYRQRTRQSGYGTARFLPVSDWDKAVSSLREEVRLLPPQETWRNVRDWGAMGNGKHDDTAALQRALDEGGPIYLPQGLYRVTDTLQMRPDSALIGMNPISTQLVLDENSPAFAGVGPAKAVLPNQCGWPEMWSMALASTPLAANPRAVGCRWTAGADSYMNDVKFVGGHGQITPEKENVPVYNASRTADVVHSARGTCSTPVCGLPMGAAACLKTCGVPAPMPYQAL